MTNRPSDSAAPNLEQLMQMGIRTARAGNKQNARMIFERVLEQNPEDERAWIWMAWAADNDVDRRRYLETALRINPNGRARKLLADMESAKYTGESRTLVRGVSILLILIRLILVVLFAVFILVRSGT